jgi:hypothetical protein
MLSALSGRAGYGKTTGDIFVNRVKTSFSKWKKVVGFVPQEDIMVFGFLFLILSYHFLNTYRYDA